MQDVAHGSSRAPGSEQRVSCHAVIYHEVEKQHRPDVDRGLDGERARVRAAVRDAVATVVWSGQGCGSPARTRARRMPRPIRRGRTSFAGSPRAATGSGGSEGEVTSFAGRPSFPVEQSLTA
jgi:hypothetical protein